MPKQTADKILRAASEAQTAAAAAAIAPHLSPPFILFLQGDLGAGKTYWARAALRALGEAGRVPSPSYALAHTYNPAKITVHHLDCYRLQGKPLGGDLLELLDDNALCFVEWPECAAELPPPDMRVRLEFAAEDAARDIIFSPQTAVAAAAVAALEKLPV